MPTVRYFDAQGNELINPEGKVIAKTVYTIQIKPGIYYQPHPAFARNESGKLIYRDLSEDYLDEHDINDISDFKHSGTRELKAEDYIYEIKRLANPRLSSSIYGLMSQYIEGFQDFGKTLPPALLQKPFLDLREYSLSGVRKIDDYSYEITIKGLYPQFIFWLAMPFFAPIPWEAEYFYSQPDMEDRNLGLGWYPVGSGPFMLTENNPNSAMILEKNPNYHEEYFPFVGSEHDIEQGYLHHKGERLPLINKAIYTLEKENIPRWNKFLQGYYDLSGVSADSFDQAIHISRTGKPTLTAQMEQKGMRLTQMTDPSVFYIGFNMLDPVVGGNSERARKLRLAISIAINYQEYIAIFLNGRGTPAQGPIPPGIFGHRTSKSGINPYVYTWDQGLKRKPIEEAKALMKEAGYPNGRDPQTGLPLILNYDVPAAGGPDDKAQLNWMRKQFAKIGISLNIRATQYNRFQEKMRTGNAQIFTWGWNADYPDPENFLFLLYGPNSKVNYGGANAANYQNPEYDRLFDLMKNRPNDEIRMELIDNMLEIVRRDAPWVFGVNTKSLILSQLWTAPFKPNTISQSTLKYIAIDVPLRNELRKKWNQPVLWPIGLFLCMMALLLLPFFFAYRRKQQHQAPRAEL
ncbi:ABC transporter substrate-binding protein [Legionella yabuuchiae]|uniref:ABC transporter substrate-binding protein n=1 Tax=Legionella yabuuchiae TaxID=376727 RepID=UPI003BF7F06A